MRSQRHNIHRNRWDLIIENKISRLLRRLINESDDGSQKKLLDWEAGHKYNPKFNPANTYKVFFNSLPSDYVNDIMSHFKGNKRIFPKDAHTIQVYVMDPNYSKDVGMKIIDDLSKIFERDGYVNIPSVDDLKSACARKRQETVLKSNKNSQEAQKKIDDMFFYWYKHYQDPEVQQLIKSFAPYGFDESKHGHVLSLRNVAILRHQKPDVTFVATEKNWRNDFNRKLTPNAKPLVYFTPLKNQGLTIGQLDSAAKRIHGDGVKFRDLSRQQQMHIEYDELGEDFKNYKAIIGYDVSDTEPIPGLPDKWLDVGFKNSMTGEPNKALEDLAAEKTAGEEVKDVGGKLYGKEGDIIKMYEGLKTGIDAYGSKIFTRPHGTDENAYRSAFVDMLERYARELIEEKAKIIKKENQDLVLDIIVTISLILCRLNPQSVARKLKNRELTKEDYLKVRDIINHIIRTIKFGITQLSGTAKNESYMRRRRINELKLRELDSVEQLVNMLGMDIDEIPSRKEIRRSKQSEAILRRKRMTETRRKFRNLHKRVW